MASSDTEIINLALSHLGIGKEIANLESEQSQEAVSGRRFYEVSRKSVLRDFPWPFATKFVALGLVATNPSEIDQEWSFSYRYPADCLRLRRIVEGTVAGNTPRQARIPHKIARDVTGLLIYTNQSNAEAEYTLDEQNVQRFSDDFVMALSFRIANYMAPRLTAGDPFGLGRRAMDMYLLHIGIAQAGALNEQQPPEEPESEFVRARD